MNGESTNTQRHQQALNQNCTSHLFFYSYDSNFELKVLLYSKRVTEAENEKFGKNENLFQEINDQVTPMDSSPMITIARLISSKFFGLFTSENINKITGNKKLTVKDLEHAVGINNKSDFCTDLPWYAIRHSNSFYNFIKLIEDNPIQYDMMPGKKIYFLEIPWIDEGGLNQNLEEIGYPYVFKYFCPVSEFNGEENSTMKLCTSTKNLMKTIDIPSYVQNTKSIYKNEQIDYYYFISCTPPCKSQTCDFEGYFLLYPLYSGIFRRNNEKWIHLHPYKGEYPDEEILKSEKCKAVIIPGSPCHIYENESFIINMLEWLRNFSNNSSYKHIKYLGICFGHQMLNHANGGKVQCRSEKKPVLQVENLNFFENFWELEFIKNSGIKQSSHMNLFEIHLDEVVEIPKFMKKLSHSDSCCCEILVSEDGRFLTLQGHPEYTPEFFLFRLLNNNIKVNKENTNVDYEEVYKEFMAKTKLKGDIDYTFRHICYNFLKFDGKSETK
jgi:GMP synthase-like glutamine amidotransferase